MYGAVKTLWICRKTSGFYKAGASWEEGTANAEGKLQRELTPESSQVVAIGCIQSFPSEDINSILVRSSTLWQRTMGGSQNPTR